MLQALGWLGMAMNVISFQCRSYRRILLFRTLSELLFAVQYGLMGQGAGMMANLLVCLRNQTFCWCERRNYPARTPIGIFCLLFLIMVLLDWQGPLSCVILFVKECSTLAYGNRNPRSLRLLTLVASVGWLCYNGMIGSTAGVVCELFSMISIVTALLRYDLPVRGGRWLPRRSE